MVNKIQKEVMVLKGGGYKEIFKFGFYNFLKYLIMNVGILLKLIFFVDFIYVCVFCGGENKIVREF